MSANIPALSVKQDIPGLKNSAWKVDESPMYRMAKGYATRERPLKRRTPFLSVMVALYRKISIVKKLV